MALSSAYILNSSTFSLPSTQASPISLPYHKTPSQNHLAATPPRRYKPTYLECRNNHAPTRQIIPKWQHPDLPPPSRSPTANTPQASPPANAPGSIAPAMPGLRPGMKAGYATTAMGGADGCCGPEVSGSSSAVTVARVTQGTSVWQRRASKFKVIF